MKFISKPFTWICHKRSWYTNDNGKFRVKSNQRFKSKFSGKTLILSFIGYEDKYAIKILRDKITEHKKVIAKTELILKQYTLTYEFFKLWIFLSSFNEFMLGASLEILSHIF